jgi:hypothetical protein
LLIEQEYLKHIVFIFKVLLGFFLDQAIIMLVDIEGLSDRFLLLIQVLGADTLIEK